MPILAAGIFVVLALLVWGVPYGNDLPHHFRLAIGFTDSIRSGDLYPSWLSHTNGGYGDPSVRFYPPALYYLLAAFRLAGADWYTSAVLIFALITVAGGVGVGLWSSNYVECPYAVVAGVLYILAPFHANELFQSGMYAQYLCASVLPFVFGFSERIVRGGRWTDSAFLGLAVAAVIFSNIPFAFVGLISVGVYSAVLLWRHFSWDTVARLASGHVCGLLISAIFWLPMLLEMKWKPESGAGQGPAFDYRNNFILDISRDETRYFWLAALAAATALFVIPAYFLLAKRGSSVTAPAVVACAAFFMATPLSKPLWDLAPLLQETQFPWRWMTVTSACAVVLAAAAIPEFIKIWRIRRPVALAAFGMMLIAPAFTIFQVMRGADFQGRAQFNQLVEELAGSPTNADFVPIWAKGRTVSGAELTVEIPEREATVVSWTHQRKESHIAAGAPAKARLGLYFYPHWKAISDSGELATEPSSDGALMIDIPGTETVVNIEFIEPASTNVSYLLSLTGFLFLLGMFRRESIPLAARSCLTTYPPPVRNH